MQSEPRVPVLLLRSTWELLAFEVAQPSPHPPGLSMGDCVDEAGPAYGALIEADPLRLSVVGFDAFRCWWKEDLVRVVIVAARSLYHPSIIKGHLWDSHRTVMVEVGVKGS